MERVVFDTWAWFEVFAENATGRHLARDYLDNPEIRVLTPSLALAEMSSKLARRGQGERIAATIAAMDGGSEVVDLPPAAAVRVGPIVLELRTVVKRASTADAMMLATARHEGARLVSGDPAFAGQPDVIRP